MMMTIDSKTPPGYAEATAPALRGLCDTRVRLNVGGQKFTTWASTLAKLPGTRLSGLTCQDPAYDQEEKEYFFDRNPLLFPYVLDAYRDGEVHLPGSVCVPAVQAELLHWGLSEQLIPVWAGDQETSALVDAALKPSSLPEAVGWRIKANSVWRFLDDARSSKNAAIWLVFYTLLLMVSLVVITVASVPEHARIRALSHVNILCSFLFLLELLVRFATCPEKCSFFCCFFNIVDILHAIPMFIACCISLGPLSVSIDIGALLAISTFFRAVRVLKISMLSWKMQVLQLALRASLKELFMLLVTETMLMVAFGSAMYFSENNIEDANVGSIPDGMWMAIITITTVGYGDYCPRTVGGKVVSATCALSGLIVIALAYSVVANNFRRIYENAEVRMKVNQRAGDKKVDEATAV